MKSNDEAADVHFPEPRSRLYSSIIGLCSSLFDILRDLESDYKEAAREGL